MPKRLRAALLTGLFGLTLVLGNIGLHTAANPETFGSTTVGTASVKPGANYKFGMVYTLAEAGQTQSFSWYASGGTSDQKFKPVVYATDAIGEPTTLLATGTETTIAANQAAGWVTATLPSVALQPGKYYLGLLSGAGTKQANIFYTAITPRTSQYNANTYPNPSAIFGTASKEAKQWSFQLTYMPENQPVPVAPINAEAPTISGLAQEGQALSSAPGSWTGDPTPTLTTKWQRCADANCTDIPGATAANYSLTAADVGSSLRIKVTGENAGGSAEALSAQTDVVTGIPQVPPTNVTPVTVSGTAQEGQTLHATAGTWDGSPTPSLNLQWQRCQEADCQNIADATGADYMLTAQDVGFTIRVVEQATNAAGTGTIATEPSAVVTPIPNTPPTNTTLPVLNGIAALDQTLTASLGEWAGRPTPDLNGQWERCIVELCTPIEAATAGSHLITQPDVGAQLRFKVTASNVEGVVEVYTDKSAVVTAHGKPTFTKHSVDAETIGVMSAKALTDINKDGKKDAVIGYRNSAAAKGGIWWYEFPASGNPDDAWIKHTIVAKADIYEDLITQDVDRDGWDDVVASVSKLNIIWYRNPGTPGGAWQQNMIGTGVGENNMLFSDLDGDGKLDLATNSAIFFQDSPTVWTKRAVGNSWLGMALMDTGSGLGQINFVRNSEVAPYDIVWHQNPREWGGNARTDEWRVHRVGLGYACKSTCATVQVATIHTGDINGDGRLDIAIANAEAPSLKAGSLTGVRWYEAPADRTQLWAHHFVDANYNNVHNMRLVDMDHNGTLDIVGGEQDQTVQRRFGVFYNDGSGAFTYESIEAGVGTHNIDVEDVDSDGDWDIIQGRHGWYGDDNPLSIYIAH